MPQAVLIPKRKFLEAMARGLTGSNCTQHIILRQTEPRWHFRLKLSSPAEPNHMIVGQVGSLRPIENQIANRPFLLIHGFKRHWQLV